jgi:hypothetical protein
MNSLLTHNRHVGALGHSFKIRRLCRYLTFVIAARVELQVDQGHPVHVRLPQLKHKHRHFLTQRTVLSAKLVPTFADRWCRVVGATDPHSRILGFLDRSRYYFFQVAPQMHSRG